MAETLIQLKVPAEEPKVTGYLDGSSVRARVWKRLLTAAVLTVSHGLSLSLSALLKRFLFPGSLQMHSNTRLLSQIFESKEVISYPV